MNRLKWNKEFALGQAADDTDLLKELIDIFKESSANDYLAIERGLSSGDAEIICAAAHSIKGAAASLGMEGIREIALDMENDSRQGSLDRTRARFSELADLLRQLRRL